MNLHVLRLPHSKNHIFSGRSVRANVYLYDYYQHDSKTNYNRKFKFSIPHLYHIQMQLEAFYEDYTKTLFKGAHKRIRI